MGSAVIGYICSLLSALANGSFASLMKAPPVARLDPPVHPLVFQFYASIGVFVSSMVTLIFLQDNDKILDDSSAIKHTGLSFYGALAGALFVSATAFSFIAIPLIGVSLAQGIWGGCAILVSCFWGVVVFSNTIDKPVMVPFALLLLIVGIIGIALCDKIKISWLDKQRLDRDNARQSPPADDVKIALISDDDKADAESSGEAQGKGAAATEEGSSSSSSRRRNIMGISSAVLVGLTGGSVLVPAHYETHFGGVAFLPSFGLGALIGALLLFSSYSLIQGKMPTLHLQNPVAAAAGILSGVIWNIGNVLQIVAIPRIGYSVGYSIYQGALFFSGLWGIVLFKEIQGVSAISIFFISAVILIVGQVLLAISIKQG